jgi:hypothetical protein
MTNCHVCGLQFIPTDHPNICSGICFKYHMTNQVPPNPFNTADRDELNRLRSEKQA